MNRALVAFVAVAWFMTQSPAAARDQEQARPSDPGPSASRAAAVGSASLSQAEASVYLPVLQQTRRRPLEFVGAIGGRPSVLLLRGDRALMAAGSTLHWLDIGDRAAPRLLAAEPVFEGLIAGVAFYGDLAVVSIDGFGSDEPRYPYSRGDYVAIVNLSNDQPRLVGTVNLPPLWMHQQVAVVGGTAYVLAQVPETYVHFLRAVSLDDPTKPVVGELVPLPGSPTTALISSAEDLLMVVTGDDETDVEPVGRLWAFRPSDTGLRASGSAEVAGSPLGVANDGERAAVVTHGEVILFDIATAPPTAIAIGQCPSIDDVGPGDVAVGVEGAVVAASAWWGVCALDFSDPPVPRVLAAPELDGKVAIGDGDLVVSAGGLRLLERSGDAFVERAVLSLPGSTQDVWLAGNRLVTSDYENPHAVLDVSNPRLPRPLAPLPMTEPVVAGVEGAPLVYAAAGSVVAAYDLAGPSPREIWRRPLDGEARAIHLSRHSQTLFVATHTAIQVVDLSQPDNPPAPQHLPGSPPIEYAYAMLEVPGFLYVGTDFYGHLLTFSKGPTGFAFASTIDVRRSLVAMEAAGDVLYGVTGDYYVEIGLENPAEPELHFMAGSGYNSATDIVAADDGLILTGGERVTAIDLSDPAHPGWNDMYYVVHNPEAADVDGDLVVIADGDGGVRLLRRR